MKRSKVDITNEYGPFDGIGHVHGVSFDGRNVWIATGEAVVAVDPDTGATGRSIMVPAQAGTAFDGKFLFQISAGQIRKLEPDTGKVVATIPAPAGANSGMAWADGSLWIGQHRERKILQVDPDTGAVLRTFGCDRYVTGVTWVDGELWHGTWENDQSELRRLDPQTGQVQEALEMPAGVGVSGLESDGAGRFFCGGGDSGKLRVVRRPARQAQG